MSEEKRGACEEVCEKLLNSFTYLFLDLYALEMFHDPAFEISSTLLVLIIIHRKYGDLVLQMISLSIYTFYEPTEHLRKSVELGSTAYLKTF